MRPAQRFVTLVAVAAAVMASLAAPASAAKEARPEACRLLRAAEVTQLLEQPTTGGTPGHAPLLCDWSLAATDTRPAGAISVFLKRGDDATDDFNLARGFGDSQVKLRGLGRRAFYAPDFDTVYVLRDPTTIFFIQGLYPSDATIDPTGLQSALVALAGKAARRV
jgi:hypothetical protein